MASIVLTGAIARFVPLGSAIAGGSPRSLRFLVTAAAGPSQGNMGEDAPPMSTKEDEVTSARRTWRRGAEASPVMQPVRWQTSGTKHPVWPEMHGGIRQRNHRGGGGLTSSLARLNRRRRASKTT
ncbi:unnamed protein product [Musa acuminata subsp. burmannicoides]